jgi:multidrug efflux pump subunit AcrA (membrane-fusion protein)
VFVQTGGETFDKRRVEAGARDGEHIEIRAGVRAGERVVSRGGFDVHLATLAGPVESHRH